MKKALIIFCLFFCYTLSFSQGKENTKTRITAGASAPELFHAGLTWRISNISLVGINAGLGPSLDGVWPSLSLEHRLYFGKETKETEKKSWFCRQGTTFFPSADPGQKFTLNLTVGKDIFFKDPRHGITIDAGVFYLPHSESSSVILVRSLDLWPALRFEFFF